MATVPHAPPAESSAQLAYWAERARERAAILDAVFIAIWLVRDHRIVWANQGFTTLLGYSREDIATLAPASCFHEVSRFEAATQEAEVALAQGRAFQGDWLMRRKDGGLFWGNVSGRVLSPEHPQAGIVQKIDSSGRAGVELGVRAAGSAPDGTCVGAPAGFGRMPAEARGSHGRICTAVDFRSRRGRPGASPRSRAPLSPISPLRARVLGTAPSPPRRPIAAARPTFQSG